MKFLQSHVDLHPEEVFSILLSFFFIGRIAAFISQ